MGSLGAIAFAEAVEDGSTGLTSAVHWNLTANHYPPLPVAYVEILVDVINRYNSEEIDSRELITIPSDLDPKPRAARWDGHSAYVIDAGTLLEITHCWGFINNLYGEDE